MARIRTFVAIELDGSIKKASADAIRVLSSTAESVRWVDPEGMHLTLKFLGDVDDRELHQVCQITKRVAEEVDPFSLSCCGLGAFPSSDKPTTIWMGLSDESETLVPMQKRLESLLFDELRIPIENRPYRAHITLGRNKSRGKYNPPLTELLQSSATEDFGSLQVNELVAFSSELTRQGPIYTPLCRCPVGKPAPNVN